MSPSCASPPIPFGFRMSRSTFGSSSSPLAQRTSSAMSHTLRKRNDRLLGAVLLISTVWPGAGPAWADETAFDFRDSKLDLSVFGGAGPNCGESVKAEQHG